VSRRLLLSCGEASGDLYAGALVTALKSLSPGIEVSGLGGPKFGAAGGRLLVDFRGLSVTGFTEWFTKIPVLSAAKRQLVSAAARERPDALVVIDYSGFNARLARDVKKLGVPVVYYISPQIWAWRGGRIKSIREIASRVLTIFPFEAEIYRRAGVPVEFVGHPMIDLAAVTEPRDHFLSRHGLDPDRSVVAILPGSRASELRRILPTLVDACLRVRASLPDVQFLLARAPHLDDRLFSPLQRLPQTVVVDGETDSVLAAANVALTASGTATVQAALHDTPMVVVYRVSPLEYALGRRFVKVNTFAMVNLIAEQQVVPELIQDDFTADAVAARATSLLTDPVAVAEMRRGLGDVRRKLGGAGASRRAAAAILEVMGSTCAES
jgi:lipid-A-disaccharide synthase